MTDQPIPGTEQCDRAYIDDLKRTYLAAKISERKIGNFVWANLCNPTAEQAERHRLLVAQAMLELGVNETAIMSEAPQNRWRLVVLRAPVTGRRMADFIAGVMVCVGILWITGHLS